MSPACRSGRFYNLLAIGRPVILVSEPDAEAALTVIEHDVGWVVEPGNAGALAQAVRQAATSEDAQRAERATEISRCFDFSTAMAAYCRLIRELAQDKPKSGL
jgi:glycosyltransferase involved in cell wall biosynthesis